MKPYHKIQSIFKRNLFGDNRLIIGDWVDPTVEFLAPCQWTFTEKVDGTNIRVIIEASTTPGVPPLLLFRGKTDAAVLPGPLLQHLHDTFDPLYDKLREQFPFGACLYGEGYGGKIQSGSAVYGPEQRFVLFDILVGDYWLERENIEEIAAGFGSCYFPDGIKVVPIIGQGTLMDAVSWAQRGIDSQWTSDKFVGGHGPAEGIVARPLTELRDRRGNRIIVKIKCRDFHAPESE